MTQKQASYSPSFFTKLKKIYTHLTTSKKSILILLITFISLLVVINYISSSQLFIKQAFETSENETDNHNLQTQSNDYSQDVIFAQITDEHLTTVEDQRYDRFKAMLKRVVAIRPRLLISTGDNTDGNNPAQFVKYNQGLSDVHGGNNQLHKFPGTIEATAPNKIPFFLIGGNHDNWTLTNDITEEYKNQYKTIQSFTVGNYRFIGFSNNFRTDFPEEALEQELKKSCTDGRSIVMFHHFPPYGWTFTPEGDIDTGLGIDHRNWTKYHNLISKYPVIAHIAGHNHDDMKGHYNKQYAAFTSKTTGVNQASIYALSENGINQAPLTEYSAFFITTPQEYYPNTHKYWNDGIDYEYSKTQKGIVKVRVYGKTTQPNTYAITNVAYSLDGGSSVPMNKIIGTDYFEANLDATNLSGQHEIEVTGQHSVGFASAQPKHTIKVFFADTVPTRTFTGCDNIPTPTPTNAPVPTNTPVPTNVPVPTNTPVPTGAPPPNPDNNRCNPILLRSNDIWIRGQNPKTVADVNGDGMADYITFANDGIWVRLRKNNSFDEPQLWVSNYGVSAGGWGDQNLYPRTLGDVNGDGMADIIGFGNKAVYVSLSTGSSFQAPKAWHNGFGVTAGGWTEQNIFPRTVADVNGDCKADIIGFGNKAVYVSLSTGSSFQAPIAWHSGYGVTAGGWTEQNIFPRLLADVNNDGKADIVAFGNKAVYVSLSTGSSFQAPKVWHNGFGVSAGGWTEQNIFPRTVADVNGDGKADIVAFGNRAVYVSLSTGSQFLTHTEWINNFGVIAGNWINQDTTPRSVMDLTGDKKDDVAGNKNGVLETAVSNGSRFILQ